MINIDDIQILSPEHRRVYLAANSFTNPIEQLRYVRCVSGGCWERQCTHSAQMEMYSALEKNYNSAKRYVFSKATAESIKQIKIVDIENDFPGLFKIIGGDDVGYLACPTEDAIISAEYFIKEDQYLFMDVFCGRLKIGSAIIFANSVETYTLSCLTSALLMGKNLFDRLETETCWELNCVWSKDGFDEEKKRVLSIIKNFKCYDDFCRACNLNESEIDFGLLPTEVKREFENYYWFKSWVETAIAMIYFIKTAKVCDYEYVSNTRDNSPWKGNCERKLDYCIVNGAWDKNINVNNPFTVRSHFRRQWKRNSDGDLVKEQVRVSSYKKNGYHRRAQKIIEGE